jgi:hypothetical protein
MSMPHWIQTTSAERTVVNWWFPQLLTAGTTYNEASHEIFVPVVSWSRGGSQGSWNAPRSKQELSFVQNKICYLVNQARDMGCAQVRLLYQARQLEYCYDLKWNRKICQIIGFLLLTLTIPYTTTRLLAALNLYRSTHCSKLVWYRTFKVKSFVFC